MSIITAGSHDWWLLHTTYQTLALLRFQLVKEQWMNRISTKVIFLKFCPVTPKTITQYFATTIPIQLPT